MADLYWPFDTSCVSEWCGTVRDGGVVHTGTDFAVPHGTELRATISGTITRWNNDGLGAYVLDIIRGDGLLVRNAHLSEMYVNSGDWVEAGQVIGRTGGTPNTPGAGYSFGPHLHWELRWDREWNGGSWQDPREMNTAMFGQEQALEPNQRVAGPLGVFRRAEPNTWSEHLQPDLEAGVVGTFDGWIYGEERDGNAVWFRGALSGNWFWSGAFTDASQHDLADLNPAPVVPTPEQPTIPEPDAPAPEPEQPTTPPTEQEPNVPNNENVNNLIGQIPQVNLGNIIGNAKVRKVVWAVYGILGLFLLAVVGGFTAINALPPTWFMFTLGSYAALGPAMSTLAMANITTKKKPK